MQDKLRGYSSRKNAKNKFHYIRLHWTADPSRDAEWKELMISRNGPRDFAISHDLQRIQLGGQGVFSDLYLPEVHEVLEQKEPHPRFGPLILGWDFGGNHSVVIGQRQGSHLVIFAEFPNMGFGTHDIAREIYEWVDEQWGHLGLQEIDVIDPAGKDAGKESTAKSCADMLVMNAKKRGRTSSSVKAASTNLIPGRLEAVRRSLRGDRFLLQLTPAVPFLKKALRGAYCWPEKLAKGRKPEPEKNIYSHCVTGDTLISTPNGSVRMDVLNPGDLVATPIGPQQVLSVMSRPASVLRVAFDDGSFVDCTADHPFFTDRGVVFADALGYADMVWDAEQFTQYNDLTESPSTESPRDTTKPVTGPSVEPYTCIGMFGNTISDQYQMATLYTTRTRTKPTMISEIWNVSAGQPTPSIMLMSDTVTQKNSITHEPLLTKSGIWLLTGIEARKAEHGTPNTRSGWQLTDNPNNILVSNVEKSIKLKVLKSDFVQTPANPAGVETAVLTTSNENVSYAVPVSVLTSIVKQRPAKKVVEVSCLAEQREVYDLTVQNAHSFFANGALTGNCSDALQYLILGAEKLTSLDVSSAVVHSAIGKRFE